MQYHGVGRHHDQWPHALHVVTNGTMTGQRYIDEVLLHRVRLFRGAVGDKFVFMDDNATCPPTLAVQDCLDSEGIQILVWPARSPDLNPIENVWDALGRQVAGRNYPPTNKNTLIRALTEEWDKLPQQLLDNVVQSMRKPPELLRCETELRILILPRASVSNKHSSAFHAVRSYAMAAVDFLHRENPPTWAGVEPATFGAKDQQQINHDLVQCGS
ncbi:transposable element Tcb2 transposase [Trichonephila clavipes]|nr:transposable element Tcb2 transposase [Trichonephila clavipes]